MSNVLYKNDYVKLLKKPNLTSHPDDVFGAIDSA